LAVEHPIAQACLSCTSIGVAASTGSVWTMTDGSQDISTRRTAARPEVDQSTMRGRRLGYLVVVVALLVVGAAIGRAVPPFTLDWPWMGKFVTSPGLGGLAAVCAAVIALIAALTASRQSARDAAADRAQREQAEQRAQWWNRFAWAADHAVDAETAELGISVLSKLIDQEWVMEEDNLIARAVADVVTPEVEDSRPKTAKSKRTRGRGRA